MPAPGKFIAITSPSPEIIYFLDDMGKIWSYSMSGQRNWEWKQVVIPPDIQPLAGEASPNERA